MNVLAYSLGYTIKSAEKAVAPKIPQPSTFANRLIDYATTTGHTTAGDAVSTGYRTYEDWRKSWAAATKYRKENPGIKWLTDISPSALKVPVGVLTGNEAIKRMGDDHTNDALTVQYGLKDDINRVYGMLFPKAVNPAVYRHEAIHTLQDLTDKDPVISSTNFTNILKTINTQAAAVYNKLKGNRTGTRESPAEAVARIRTWASSPPELENLLSSIVAGARSSDIPVNTPDDARTLIEARLNSPIPDNKTNDPMIEEDRKIWYMLQLLKNHKDGKTLLNEAYRLMPGLVNNDRQLQTSRMA